MEKNEAIVRLGSPSAAQGEVEQVAKDRQPWILSVINTDFGGDCDDQKAISQHIADMGPDDRSFFIVSGPHPKRASEAIAQAYFGKMGKYPIVALGQQFEQQKVPEEKIFSIINSEAMCNQEVEGFEPTKLVTFHAKIDAELKYANVGMLKQCVFGPLHNNDEYYDPSSRLDADATLKKNWGSLSKVAVVQFQRAADDKDGFQYSGNNFQKSKPDVSEKFNEMLLKQGYETTYFEGAVAKSPEFLLSARQEKLPGIEKSIATYMENLQVPWANMPGKSGTTPESKEMHTSMFTPKGEVPFGVHAAGGIPAGFGIERLSKEVCGIPPGTESFEKLAEKIGKELDRFDGQVLQQLNKQRADTADYDLFAMRAEMHQAMSGALLEYAEKNGLPATSATSFKQLFAEAKTSGVKLNPFTYMHGFKEVLFEKSPLTRDITAIAVDQANLPSIDGKNHLDNMTGILSSYGARAVGYDAVTLAAADTLARNSSLAAHFEEKDGARNVTLAKVEDLRKSKPKLFEEFVGGTRAALTRDGGALANDWEREARTAERQPTPAPHSASPQESSVAGAANNSQHQNMPNVDFSRKRALSLPLNETQRGEPGKRSRSDSFGL